MLRSPHAHARIRAIDTSAAERLPGVKAIITGKDLPLAEDKVAKSGEGSVNYSYLRQNVLAQDKVRTTAIRSPLWPRLTFTLPRKPWR